MRVTVAVYGIVLALLAYAVIIDAANIADMQTRLETERCTCR